MKVLVIGSGGREHALVWKLRQSPRLTRLFCAPGNAGIARQAECVPIAAEDVEGLLAFAAQEGVDLTVVGPEAPLAHGIANRFSARGLRIFGPTREAAAVETSKAFAKELLRRHGIPTAPFRIFNTFEEARRYVQEQGAPIVVKADGLAAGKGAVVAQTVAKAEQALRRFMVEGELGEAGRMVVVEACLQGEEASVLALTDGQSILPLAPAQDHKPVFDGDRGPNTGGMGAYSPVPLVAPALQERIRAEVLEPAVKGLAAEGRPYRGVLYAGLMVQGGVPYVLEFNARFGDPEAQPILVRMQDDLLPWLLGVAEGQLPQSRISWDPRAAVCVVMASAGYPGPYAKGHVIRGLEEAGRLQDVVIFHAGTAARDGDVVTSGGRVLGVTALGDGIGAAIERAYEAVRRITWEGVHYRTDIGQKAQARLKGNAAVAG